MDAVTLAAANAFTRRGRQISGRTAVLLGDSFMAFNGGPVSGSLGSWDSKGIVAWANYYLGQRLSILYNAGVGGQQMNAYLARVPTDVDAYKPTWVIGCGGINDISAGRTTAQMIADYTALFNYLINTKGYRVSWNTVTSVTTWTNAQLTTMTEVNMWLRAAPSIWPNLVIADVYDWFFDPTQGIPAAWRVDTTHPNPAGAVRMGKAIANALAPHIPAVSPLDVSGTASSTSNICTNGRFINPASGLGSGWSISGTTTATISQVARTDRPAGSWQRMVVPNGTSCAITRTDTIGTKATPGVDKIRLAVELNATNQETAPATQTQRVRARLQILDASSTILGDWDALYSDSGYSNHLYELGQGVLATPHIPLPATANKVAIFLYAFGGGTYDWDKVTVFRVMS